MFPCFMTTEIVPSTQGSAEIVGIGSMAAAGRAADAFARQHVLEEHIQGKADNTARAQAADLKEFAKFLRSVGVDDAPDADQFMRDAHAWRYVTYGLVKAFRAWMEGRGYAVGTINRRLATVRKFSALAFEAGIVPEEQYALIRLVHGLNAKNGFTLDEKRAAKGIPTRRSSQKKGHPKLTNEQARALKRQPDTPQGRRDALLMCLLIDHGLRVGEVVNLKVADFDLKASTFTLRRPKVKITQVHEMTPDTRRALRRWIDAGDIPAMGKVLRGSRKGGALTHAGMTERTATERVRVLGERIGVPRLSAHSCRHFWTRFHRARAERGEVTELAIKQAGGWASFAMLEHYAGENDVANAGLLVSV